jgi:hypothetical protein
MGSAVMYNFKKRLLELVNDDQEIRNKYVVYLKRYKKWEIARDKWVEDTGVNPTAIFNDGPRLKEASELIKQNINVIKNDSEFIEKIAVLVQHMDYDVDFQKWFYKYLPKTSQWRKFMYDRIAVNSGKSQKYGTQTI